MNSSRRGPPLFPEWQTTVDLPKQASEQKFEVPAEWKMPPAPPRPCCSHRTLIRMFGSKEEARKSVGFCLARCHFGPREAVQSRLLSPRQRRIRSARTVRCRNLERPGSRDQPEKNSRSRMR